MTCCSTYIGDLADPAFHWDGGDWNGNIPRGISPAFPPLRTPDNYNRKFHGWVARVGKAQLLDFIQYYYGPETDELINKLIYSRINPRANYLLEC